MMGTCVFAQAQLSDSVYINGRYLSNGLWGYNYAGVMKYSALQFKQMASTNNVTHIGGIMKDQRFRIAVPADITPGVYRISPGWNDVIINGNEKEIAYTLDAVKKDSTSVDFTASEENKLYQNYLKQSTAQLKLINELERKYHKSKNGELQKQINDRRGQYQKDFENFCKQYDGTWAALLVKNNPQHFAPLDMDSVKAKRYLHRNNYWDGLDTSNPKLVNTPLYLGVIENYVYYYFDKSLKIDAEALGDSLVTACDTILAHFGGNEDTKGFAVKHLEALFMMTNQEKPLHFVDTFYAGYLDNSEQCTDEDEKSLAEQFRQRIARDNVISEGLQAPEIDIEDVSGKHKTLKDIPGDRLLLMFWQENCSHCEEQMPEIEEYMRTNPNEITVLAICITPNDKNYQDAKNAFPHLLFTCDNKMGGNKYDGAATKAYFVNGTPNYFLLDKNRKIIGAYYTWDIVKNKLK
ncbi:MAG: redoxin domain-containing protein [Prevotella sp.]|nr:redoxin domain-containing protein [Prevotella sp.]MCI1282007.1 redoxin domain-containing protein [Prevotella sp.]